MPWPELLDTITTAPTSRLFSGERNGPQALLDAVRRDQPPIFWYPGCNTDLTPLLYAQHKSMTDGLFNRLFPQTDQQDRTNLVFWMSEFNEWRFNFPEIGETIITYPGSRTEQERTVKVKTIGRFAIPVESKYEGRRIHIPLTVFRATVGSGHPFTVFYSAAETKTLLECVLIPHALPIKVVVIVDHESFGMGRNDFSHYRDLPRILNEKQKVGAYLVDRRYDDFAIPGFYRKSHNRDLGIGGTDVWSSEPCEILTRDETKRRLTAAINGDGPETQ